MTQRLIKALNDMIRDVEANRAADPSVHTDASVYADAINKHYDAITSALLNVKLQMYRKWLRQHDWFFEDSGNEDVWKTGRAQRYELRIMQRDIDPTGEIWNQYAPDDFKLRKNKR